MDACEAEVSRTAAQPVTHPARSTPSSGRRHAMEAHLAHDPRLLDPRFPRLHDPARKEYRLTTTATAVGPAPPAPPALLTVAEFWNLLDRRVGLNTLYRLVHDGRIRSIRLGERKILIPATELTDWPHRELETPS